MPATHAHTSIEALLPGETVGRFAPGQERPRFYAVYVVLVAVAAVAATRVLGIDGILQYAIVGAAAGGSASFVALPVLVAEVGTDIVVCQSSRWRSSATRIVARLAADQLAHLGGSWLQRWRIGSHVVHVSGKRAAFLRDALDRRQIEP
jgi:hypothetical protein